MAGRPQHCAIMFADLSGSTALYEKLGNVAAKEAVHAALRRMAEIITAHRGRVIKNIGDEVLSCFPEGPDAAQAALQLQAEDGLRLAGERSGVRIGLHFGEVIADDNDIFGDAVNVAARVTSAARARQVLLSEAMLGQLSEAQRALSRPFDVVAFKGKTQPMRLVELVWDSGRNVTKLATHMHQAATTGQMKTHTRLELVLADRRLSLDEDQVPLDLGRDASCGMLVDSPSSSRIHARLEYQRGKFVLSDCSTNGTYVRIGAAPEVFLRRESMPLVDSGTISLGCPAAQRPEAVVSYRTT